LPAIFLPAGFFFVFTDRVLMRSRRGPALGVRKQLPAGTRRGLSASTQRRPDRRATRDGSRGLLALARVLIAASAVPAVCAAASIPVSGAGPLREAALWRSRRTAGGSCAATRVLSGRREPGTRATMRIAAPRRREQRPCVATFRPLAVIRDCSHPLAFGRGPCSPLTPRGLRSLLEIRKVEVSAALRSSHGLRSTRAGPLSAASNPRPPIR